MKKRRKKNIKISIYSLLGLFLFVFFWYVIIRIKAKILPVSLRKNETVRKTDNPNKKFLKVGTYNIAHGRGGKTGASNWQYRTKKDLLKHLDTLSSQILQENLDILVLNEVDFNSNWSFNVDQAVYIANKCNFPYNLEQINIDISVPFFRYCFGNAILSKYPINKYNEIDFSSLSTFEEIVAGDHDGAYCEINTPIGILGVFTIHLEYRSEDIRVKNAEQLIEQCDKLKTPFIAIGDFNSTPIGSAKFAKTKDGKNAMTVLFENNFKSYLNPDEYSKSLTFPAEKPNRILDWIIGKNIEFKNSKRIQSQRSDHLMITSEISPEEK